jgi:hypothetical protein
MNIVAFKPEHLKALVLQPSQEYFGAEIQREGYGDYLKASGQAFTAMDGDKVLGCGGCIEIWDNRAQIWALVSRDAGRHMIGIHRAVAGFLLAAKWRRIEASVDVGFEAGIKWLEMLGFNNETPGTPMRAYRPDGGNSYLFARVEDE